MNKFVISRQKFEGETKVSTEYVALDSNNNIASNADPSALDSFFGSKEQAEAFKENYKKYLAATEAEEGVTYKVRVKAASQAVRDFCTESIHRLEDKATVTEEAQAAVLESIKVIEPEKVEQPAEATVTEAKPKKTKKAKKAEPEAEQVEATA